MSDTDYGSNYQCMTTYDLHLSHMNSVLISSGNFRALIALGSSKVSITN